MTDLLARLRADRDRLQSAAAAIRPHPQNAHKPVPAAYVASFVDREIALASLSMDEAAARIEAMAGEIEGLRSHIAEQIQHVEQRIADGKELGASVWRIALEDVVRENRTALTAPSMKENEDETRG